MQKEINAQDRRYQHQTNYRPDIDGLRAVAIICVLIYHAFPNALPGGFIGVDIFFVISGFLISSIIFKHFATENFSFTDFYFRRVKRIFPALLPMLVFCLALGWIALLDFEYQPLGKQIAAAAGFVSNIVLWREGGYFDTAAETKPLLHMWSLAIEEQFYIVWPFLLFLLRKRPVNYIICGLLFITTGSFLYSLYETNHNSIAAFYSPLSRIWELSGGGLFAYLLFTQPKAFTSLYSSEKIRNACSGIGFLLVSTSLLVISKKTQFPGWYAILPILGTMLILFAGPNSFLNRIVLSNKFFVWIGLISYPLYLWHWPLLSYSQIIIGETPLPILRISILLISIILAWATYRFIEKPLRGRTTTKTTITFLSLLMVATGASGYFIYNQNGLKFRSVNQKNTNNIYFAESLPPQNTPSTCENDLRIDKNLTSICTKFLSPNSSKHLIVLWGDSSSSAWSPAFLGVAKNLNISVVLFSHPSCPPLTGVRKTYFQFPEARKYCSDSALGTQIIASIQQLKPTAIFLLGAWNNYTPIPEGIKGQSSIAKEYITEVISGDEANEESSAKALKHQIPITVSALDAIAKVVVFKPWPTLKTPPNYNVDRIGFLNQLQPPSLLSYAEHKTESQFIDDIFKSIKANRTTFLDPAVAICTEYCNYVVSGRKIYQDTYHVTPQGSLILEDQIRTILENLSQ